VGTGVSFLGHFHWTFGKRSNHARALLRFLVVAGGGFLLSAGMMHVALEWLRAPVWAALASIVIAVPALSWLSGRYWAFR
jgi:putative flippase GtrA